MSTCPEKDIHSIYIDNELPAAYVAEYEAHVKSCPRCQAELARLRAFRQSFSSDSKNMMLDQAALDAGFSRLQARLSYSKVTGKNVHPFDSLKNSTTMRYLAGAAVAAAIIAVILPVRTNTSSAHNAAQFQPIARAKLQSPANADVKVDGAINTTTLSSLLGSSSNGNSANSASSYASTVSTMTPVMGMSGSSRGSAFSTPVSIGAPVFVSSDDAEMLRSTITSYDVFCPMIEDVDSAAHNQHGLTIRFSSATGNFTLEIGNDK